MAQSDNENVKIVQTAFEHFKNGNLDGILATLQDDVEWETPFPRGIVPFGGKRKGKAQVKEFFEALEQTSETLRFEPREYFGSGDVVVALGYYEGKARSTGRTASTEFAMTFRLRNGKVYAFREYADSYVVAQAFTPQTAGVR
jgi:hypothetical protein